MIEPKRPVNRRFKLIIALLSLVMAVLSAQQAPKLKAAITQPSSQTADTASTEEAATVTDESKAPTPSPGYYRVVKVEDGDTITVRMENKDETVRLIGVDTPETKDPRKPVQCFGQKASDHTHQLLDGQAVRLEADPLDSDRDKYHRLLRYVYKTDGTLINAALIQDGYGFAYTVFPFQKSDEFRALQQEARTANRGLWAGCQINESTQIKQTQPAQ